MDYKSKYLKYKKKYLDLIEKIGNEIKVQKAGALTNEDSFNDALGSPSPRSPISNLNRETNSELFEKLDSMGLIPIRITGDGNCFFRAISKNVTGSEENYEYLRGLLVDSLDRDPFTDIDEVSKKENQELIDNYRSGKWKENPTWQSNEYQIRRMAEIIGRTIHVLDADSGNEYKFNTNINDSPATPENPIILINIGNMHYETAIRNPEPIPNNAEEERLKQQEEQLEQILMEEELERNRKKIREDLIREKQEEEDRLMAERIKQEEEDRLMAESLQRSREYNPYPPNVEPNTNINVSSGKTYLENIGLKFKI